MQLAYICAYEFLAIAWFNLVRRLELHSHAALPHRLIQTYPTRHRDIQTLHAARHGNTDQLIAGLAS